ncbi:hypothetical protein [Nocardioides sp. URHA0020]|uniref:hypothetical protein n=1 Tax=Nocardioides sp. URHA0020 TaxID=1380392 RepID=UPI0004910300|nr:hypothetical protein [Nocardioides sp. URHA0020]
MDRSTAARIGMAGAVAGAGLAIGGVAMASAENDGASTAPSASAEPGGHRGDRGQDAKVLATELGLEQDVVQKALDAVREDLRPDRPSSTDGTRPTPPTAAQRAERRAALATALAKKLGVSEAKVKAALAVAQKQADADRAERRAESRTALVTRLDAAVTAGTLTKADKASVLKAFDAALIEAGGDGPGGGRGR